MVDGRSLVQTPAKHHLACLGASLALSLGTMYTNVTIRSLYHIDPLIFNLYRQLCATLILFAASQEIEAIKPERKDLPQVVLLGFLLFLDLLGFTSDMAHKGGLPSICFHASIPAITTFLALAFKTEQLSWSRILAMLAVVGGTLMASIGEVGDAVNKGTSSGVLYALGSSVARAGYLIVLRRMVMRYPPLSTTAWAFLISSIWTALDALLTIPFGTQWVLSRRATGPLAYWALIGSCCVYLLYGLACKTMLSSQVSLYQSLVPVITLLFSLPYMNFVPTWSFVGIVLIFSGIAWSFSTRLASKVTPLIPTKNEAV